MMASATSYEMALGSAIQVEFLCREQLCQAIEEHQNYGHGHDNHIVADATEGEKLQAERTHIRKSIKISLSNISKCTHKKQNYKGYQ